MKNVASIVVPIVSCIFGAIGAWFILKDRMEAEVEKRVRYETRVERLEAKAEQNRVDIWEIKSK